MQPPALFNERRRCHVRDHGRMVRKGFCHGYYFRTPTAIEQQLRAKLADCDAVAKEAALVELYRQAKLTHHQLAASLGVDRFSVDHEESFMATTVNGKTRPNGVKNRVPEPAWEVAAIFPMQGEWTE